MNVKDFIAKANNKYNDFYNYNTNTFQGMNTNMEIECPTHGVFEQTPKSHLSSKFGCPLCANLKKKKRTVKTDKLRIGKETTTNAGFHVICVEYKRADNITVLFDDGTRVKTTWANFIHGRIDHPIHKNYRKADTSQYVGMTAYSSFGELMTITAARRANDIDVMFPDGSIAYHKRWECFKNGEIKRPTQTADEIFQYRKQMRLGKIKKQSNGLNAKIIEYHKTYVVAEFENGRRRRGTYSQFSKGLLKPSQIHNIHDVSRIGEKRVLSDGHIIEIVEYESSQHIIITIDGTKKKHTNYRWFQEAKYIDSYSQERHMGKFIISKERSEKVGKMNYNLYTGEKMTIIEYNGNSCITIKFEDGTIVNNVKYQLFKKGLVMNPNRPNRNQVSLNEYAILYCLRDYGFIHAKRGSLKAFGLGMKEIDIFNPKYKIGIEYDGRMHNKDKDLRKNVACEENGIKLYRLQESIAPVLNIPNCYRLADNNALSDDLLITLNKIIADINVTTSLNIKPIKRLDRNKIKAEFYEFTYAVNDVVGMSRKIKNGDVLTVVRYGGVNDIDISLSNGKILKHKTMQAFKEYSWQNQTDYNKAYWEDQTKIINNRKYTLVTYYSCTKILVKCEDGFEKLISKYNWDKGKIIHPSDVIVSPSGGILKNRIGEKGKSVTGLDMTITEYEGCNNMTVTFSDGRIAHNVTYQAFSNGHVAPDGTNILSEKLRLQRIGETYQVKCGKIYTIIDYKSCANTVVQDEYGNIKVCNYHYLKRCKVV